MGTLNQSPITIQSMKHDSKLWLLPAGVGSVIILMFVLLVIPMIRGIYDDFNTIKSKKVLLKQLVEKRTALALIDDVELTQQLTAVNRVLPSSKPVMTLITSLSGTATEAGVLLNSYELAPGEVATSAGTEKNEEKIIAGKLTELGVKSSVSGTYGQMMSFLKQLMKTAPLTFLPQVSLSGETKAREDTAEFATEMDMVVYFSLPLSELGPIEEPLPELSVSAQAILSSITEYKDYASATPPVVTQENRGNLFTY